MRNVENVLMVCTNLKAIAQAYFVLKDQYYVMMYVENVDLVMKIIKIKQNVLNVKLENNQLIVYAILKE